MTSAMSNEAPFVWWCVMQDGTAEGFFDSPDIRKKVDTSKGNWFGRIEGCILHGGVKATAFERKTEQTYDAAEWLKTKRMIPMGFVTTTKITAEWKE
jgi:hypothetical protein